MTAWIRRWTPEIEFSVVTIIAFIMPVAGSILLLMKPSHASLFSDYSLIRTVLFEAITLFVIGFIFYVREFDIRSLAFNVSWRLTAQGLILYLAAVVAVNIAARVTAVLYPAAGSFLSSIHHGNFTLVNALAISIVNPLFEELLLVGYIITAFEKIANTTRAILVSVSIRGLCHFYQGPAGVAGIMVMGILFVYIFVRKRQLWPLIVAHGVLDFVALMALPKT